MDAYVMCVGVCVFRIVYRQAGIHDIFSPVYSPASCEAERGRQPWGKGSYWEF